MLENSHNRQYAFCNQKDAWPCERRQLHEFAAMITTVMQLKFMYRGLVTYYQLLSVFGSLVWFEQSLTPHPTQYRSFRYSCLTSLLCSASYVNVTVLASAAESCNRFISWAPGPQQHVVAKWWDRRDGQMLEFHRPLLCMLCDQYVNNWYFTVISLFDLNWTGLSSQQMHLQRKHYVKTVNY